MQIFNRLTEEIMGSILIFIILLIIILAKAINTVREDQRLAIFRLGRFFTIAGPGLVLLIPVVDKGVKVNLRGNIPGWQGSSKSELDEKIRTLVLNQPIQ
jgi:regulator of protease activity HflC (stomatin/prohibitin superfamily)